MKSILKKYLALLLSGVLSLPSFSLSLAAAEGISRKVGDYTGKGTVIAVIDAGFDVSHEVFSAVPTGATLDKNDITRVLGIAYGAAYVSEKIPFAYDYGALGDPFREGEAEIDTDVLGPSEHGTASASLAAGHYIGKGDTVAEDGTVTRDGDFAGAAPDAQLLLMKASDDTSAALLPEAVVAAITDALRLGADVILLNLENTVMTDAVAAALRRAAEKGVPVIAGAGNLTADRKEMAEKLPASVPDRGTLMKEASLPSVYLIGAAGDPYAIIRSFFSDDTEIWYTDSTEAYLGVHFARYFNGCAIEYISVPGVGAPADYERLDAEGKVALVMRGEIPFTEKAKAAADAGCIGMIVADNGTGLSQMALDGTAIPAVMVNEADGAALYEKGSGTLTFPPVDFGVADFSAGGLTGGFDAAVSFLTEGEIVLVAAGGGYAYGSGTGLSAARAAGYTAAAVEYMKKAGIRGVSPVALAAAAASPAYGDEILAFPPREAGAGLLTKESTFPRVIPAAQNGGSVSIAESETTSATFVFTLTNTGVSAVHCDITASFFTEAIGADGRFTGEILPVPEASLSVENGTLDRFGERTDTVVVNGGRTARVTVTVTLPEETVKTLSENAPYGFFLDGTVSVSAKDETVYHPTAVFFGDRDAAPLADRSVYDETDALVAPSYLAVRLLGQTGTRTIGSYITESGESVFDEAYNIVSPEELRLGRLELHLAALRDIDEARVSLTDEDGHVLTEGAVRNIERYLTAGDYTVVPLSNFRAADENEYLFPDGTYFIKVTLSANGGGSTETLTFTVTADTVRPEIGEISVERNENGTAALTVSVSDNVSLASVRVYDLARPYGGEILCGKEAACSFDITGYRGTTPLYIEVTDTAGSYKVVRLTDRDIAAIRAAAP